ncbi:MAG TPA: hypothetical protein VJ654_02955 [Noviherbaspirillum sp.]|nr:hypothetical protein [Noviherbaspirillum sp.]
MAKSSITFKAHVAWWLHWYLCGVVLMAKVTSMQPNEAKARYWIRSAIKIKVEK